MMAETKEIHLAEVHSRAEDAHRRIDFHDQQHKTREETLARVLGEVTKEQRALREQVAALQARLDAKG